MNTFIIERQHYTRLRHNDKAKYEERKSFQISESQITFYVLNFQLAQQRNLRHTHVAFINSDCDALMKISYF